MKSLRVLLCALVKYTIGKNDHHHQQSLGFINSLWGTLLLCIKYPPLNTVSNTMYQIAGVIRVNTRITPAIKKPSALVSELVHTALHRW